MIRIRLLLAAGVLLPGALAAQEIGLPPPPAMRDSRQIEAPRLRVVRPFTLRVSEATGVDPDSLRMVGSGVWVQDVERGDGEPVGAGDEVSVRYVGMLADGTVFDASTAGPFRFRLGAGSVIPGWEEGVAGMRTGARRILVIPSHLGYGSRGAGMIPPDATLVFHVAVVARH